MIHGLLRNPALTSALKECLLIFFRAESEVQECSEGFKVGLVNPKECPPELLEKIEKKGIDL